MKNENYLVFRSLYTNFAHMNGKKRLLGMTLTELKSVVSELGMSAFTAKQIAQWLYEKHVRNIDEMTNLSKQNRQRLAEGYEVGLMEPMDCQRSKDEQANKDGKAISQQRIF